MRLVGNRPSVLRAALLVSAALVASVASCGREPTSPAGAPGVTGASYSRAFAVQPVFPTVLSQVSGGSGLVPFATVHVVLRRHDGRIALDTVVTVPAGSDQLSLSLKVRLSAGAPTSGEQLQLTMDYVNAAGATVFHGGPVTVTAVPSGSGQAPPPPIEIPVVYTGPGATAAAVRIAPKSLTVFAGDPFTFTAQALDGASAPVANTPIFFTVTDGPATINAAGTGVAGTTRGTAHIVAQLLTGPTDVATLTVALRASAVSLVSGGGQTGVAGSALGAPVVVRVTAADGVGVAGVNVSFSAGSGGSVGTASATTDASGNASSSWTLGAAPGAQSLTVSSGGLSGSPISVTATATPKPPIKLVFSGVPTTVVAASAFGATVTAQDADGNIATGFSGTVTLALPSSPAGGSLSGTTTATAVNGITAFTGLTLNIAGPSYVLTASSGGLTPATSGGITVVPGPATSIAFTSGPSNIVAGQAMGGVAVTARDAAGNIATGFTDTVTLALGSNPGAGTLAGLTSATAVGGVATFGGLSVNRVGAGYTLAASSGLLPTTTSGSFTVSAGPAAGCVLVSGNNQTAATGTLLSPIVIAVVDASGNALAGANVTASVSLGGGSLAAATVVANAQGQASFAWTTGASPGAQQLTINCGSTLIVSATASGGAPAVSLTYTVSPSNAVAGVSNSPAIVVQARTAVGALATGYTGSVALTFGANPGTSTLSGTTTVAAVGGTATFNNISLNHIGTGYTLVANSGALTAATSAAFNITAAASTTLAISAGNGQSGFTGAALGAPLSVKVTDAFTNPVAGVTVNWAVTAGGGSVAAPTSVTNASGVATIALTLGATPGANSATATVSGLAGSPATFNATGTVFAFTAITTGRDATCALTALGAAYCWGLNNTGQGGDGTTVDKHHPTPVAGGLTFTKISAGGSYTCGIATGGAAYCWGGNIHGILGALPFQTSPVAITGGLTFTDITAGGRHVCALTAAGAAYCWGYRGDNTGFNLGGVGDGGNGGDALAPVAVSGGIVFTSLTAGSDHTCGLTAAGVAWCWGQNGGIPGTGSDGRIGDGTGTPRPTPVLVSGGLTFSTISAGDGNTCGVTALGAAYCWGNNSNGQIGIGLFAGSFFAAYAPMAVSGGITFSTIAVGWSFGAPLVCGLDTAGASWCWGSNANTVGGIGDNTTIDRAVPTATVGGLLFSKIAVNEFTCALTPAGVPYCWGRNVDAGQLGDGTLINRLIPTAVVP